MRDGTMDSERFFLKVAETTDADPGTDAAPARLKSRMYSRLLVEQASTGPLLSLSETRESGRSVCVFELLVAQAPVPDRVKSMNPCTVCHARYLAERLDQAPIFWPHCPYSEFHRG